MRDLVGAIRAPEYIQAHLLRRGGINPFSEPMYRLVWGPSRIIRQGGLWHDWDKNLTVQERGGVVWNFENGVMVPTLNKPRQVVAEIREIPKYGFEGWVLERWVPASHYGSRDAWYGLGMTVPHTTIPLLGPFPDHGDYEMVGGGEDEKAMPTIGSLDEAISGCERLRHRHRSSVEQEVRERVNRAEDDYRKQQDRAEQETLAVLRKNRGILLGTSLAAGRIRNEWARKAGISEHVGN